MLGNVPVLVRQSIRESLPSIWDWVQFLSYGVTRRRPCLVPSSLGVTHVIAVSSEPSIIRVYRQFLEPIKIPSPSCKNRPRITAAKGMRARKGQVRAHEACATKSKLCDTTATYQSCLHQRVGSRWAPRSSREAARTPGSRTIPRPSSRSRS